MYVVIRRRINPTQNPEGCTYWEEILGVEMVFTTESLARIYCFFKNKDAWIDRCEYTYEKVMKGDDQPELIESILKGE